MSEPELQVFVWREFSPDYTVGSAFAIAENIEEARDMVVDCVGYEPDQWGKAEIYPLGVKVAHGRVGGM